MDIVAATRPDDITQTKSAGRPINTHVVKPALEPKPDYEKMRRLLEGEHQENVKQGIAASSEHRRV